MIFYATRSTMHALLTIPTSASTRVAPHLPLNVLRFLIRFKSRESEKRRRRRRKGKKKKKRKRKERKRRK